MDAQQRMAYRANKLGFWLRRLVELKGDERKLKQTLDFRSCPNFGVEKYPPLEGDAGGNTVSGHECRSGVYEWF